MKKIKYYISKEKGLRKTEDKKRKSELKKTLEEKKKNKPTLANITERIEIIEELLDLK